MDRLARAADAALDVNLALYTHQSRARDAEALEVLEESLVESLGVSRLAEALVRRSRAA